jgi:hypothetical protein
MSGIPHQWVTCQPDDTIVQAPAGTEHVQKPLTAFQQISASFTSPGPNFSEILKDFLAQPPEGLF